MGDLNQFIDSTASLFLNEIFAPLKDENGASLPSRYEVLFFPPSGRAGSGVSFKNIFANLGRGEQRDISMQCNKLNFPGRNLDTTVDTNIYGPTRTIVNGFSFAPVSATFYCNENYKEKQFFETWQRLAYNPQTWSMQYYDDYVGKMEIYSLDRAGARRYGVRLWECFPRTIAQQALDATPAATPQTVDVEFTYRYWQNLTDEADLPKPLLETLQRVLANEVERVLINNIPKVIRKL